MRDEGLQIDFGTIVPTVYDKRQVMAGDARQPEKGLWAVMVAEPIPNNVTVKEALPGLTVLNMNRSQGGRAYQKLVDRIYHDVGRTVNQPIDQLIARSRRRSEQEGISKSTERSAPDETSRVTAKGKHVMHGNRARVTFRLTRSTLPPLTIAEREGLKADIAGWWPMRYPPTRRRSSGMVRRSEK